MAAILWRRKSRRYKRHPRPLAWGALSGLRRPSGRGLSFSKGRLTRIARGTSTIDYRYDRFGRLTQDGELTYGYDANGNPASLGYPGGVTAVTTYDFADRPASLLAQRPGKPDQPLVSSASYLPNGPLASLALGNGLTEAHAFTPRYFPSAITLGSPGNLLSWTYATDNVGNISAITDTLNSTRNRTFGYQDSQYFLTQGNGPWGTRAWTYDKIGNRLTENHAGTTDTYTYQLVPPPGTGHSPILSSIALGVGGTKTYQYDPAGNLKQIAQGTTSTLFTNDDAGRLAALETTSPRAGVAFNYDGRDYLALADTAALPFFTSFETGDICDWSAALGVTTLPTCAARPAVHPTYSSEGLLHALQRATAPQRSYLFHFAGRPVAQMDLTGTTESWKLLTVDHLGTPIAATGTSGTLLWQGGFEPFGADWSGAGGAGVFLRLPGQWEDGVWGGLGTAVYYNVYRWYEARTDRYSRPDPLGLLGGSPNEFLYATANPLDNFDPLGRAFFAKRPLHHLPWLGPLSCNPIDDQLNTEISHEQLFFEDGKSPENLGFFDDGTVREEKHPSGFRCQSRRFNDCIMRKAVAKTGVKPYCALGKPGPVDKFNCQDWADKVRQNYSELEKEPKIRKECGCDNAAGKR